jgi:hypothetical protein
LEVLVSTRGQHFQALLENIGRGANVRHVSLEMERVDAFGKPVCGLGGKMRRLRSYC